MDLDRLREFSVLADAGSLKAASERLNVAPATLSARLHAFEHSLNARLISVQGRSLRLTEQGESLLIHAHEILNRYQALTGAVSIASRHAYRKLKIALSETSLPLFLGPFLDQLNLTWPEIRIDLVDGSRMQIAQSLLSGAVDLYFALLMDKSVPDGLIRYDIAQPFQHVLLPSQHRLAQSTSISLADLDGETFILSPNREEACVRNFQLTNLAAAGIRYKTYDSETDAAYTKLLVPIGKGVFLMPTPAPDMPPNAVSISVRGLPYPATPCVFACRRSENPDVSQFMTDFMVFCQNSLKSGPRGKEARRDEDRASL